MRASLGSVQLLNALLWIVYLGYGAAVLAAAAVALGLRLRAARVQGAVYAAYRPSRPWRVLGLLSLAMLAWHVLEGGGIAPVLIDLVLIALSAAVLAFRLFETDRVCAAGGVRIGARVAPWERLERWDLDGGHLVVELGNRRGEFAVPRDLSHLLKERLEREARRREPSGTLVAAS